MTICKLSNTLITQFTHIPTTNTTWLDDCTVQDTLETMFV